MHLSVLCEDTRENVTYLDSLVHVQCIMLEIPAWPRWGFVDTLGDFLPAV